MLERRGITDEYHALVHHYKKLKFSVWSCGLRVEKKKKEENLWYSTDASDQGRESVVD